MKMKVSLIMVFILICALSFSIAESNEQDNTQILFRGFDWYATKSEIEQKLFSEGATSAGLSSTPNTIYHMSDSESWSFTTDRIENGGYRGWYSGISVAGYEVNDTYICYIYPITNGKIMKDDEQAQMYMGWYTFAKRDYVDHQSIYDDLSAKLSSLYGNGSISNTQYSTSTIWTDDVGNSIRLWINDDKDEVALGYMSADANKRLDAMTVALENEAAAAESEQRQKNASNTSGL